MDILANVAGALAFLIACSTIVLLCAPPHPRRGSYVMPPLEEGRAVVPPVMFHSKYCAGRYGSPCNCEGPHPT